MESHRLSRGGTRRTNNRRSDVPLGEDLCRFETSFHAFQSEQLLRTPRVGVPVPAIPPSLRLEGMSRARRSFSRSPPRLPFFSPPPEPLSNTVQQLYRKNRIKMRGYARTAEQAIINPLQAIRFCRATSGIAVQRGSSLRRRPAACSKYRSKIRFALRSLLPDVLPFRTPPCAPNVAR